MANLLGPTAGAAVLSADRGSSEPGAGGSDDRSAGRSRGHRTPGGAGDAVLAVLEGPDRDVIIRQLAQRYRVPVHVAEDWFQEAYLNVLQHFSVPGRTAPADPTAYAFTVVRNVANRQWTRSRRRREVPVGTGGREEEDPRRRSDDGPVTGPGHDGDPVRVELEIAARAGGWAPWLLSATLSMVTLSTADGPLQGLPLPRADRRQVLGWQALHLAGRSDLCVSHAPDNVRQTRSRAIRRILDEVQAAMRRAAARGEVDLRG